MPKKWKLTTQPIVVINVSQYKTVCAIPKRELIKSTLHTVNI